MEDGTHFQVNGLPTAEGPFDNGEFLGGGHGVFEGDEFGGYAGANKLPSYR